MSRVTAVQTKWTRGAGYGGYGALMGSKNLKAILFKGMGLLPDAWDMDRTREMIWEVARKRLRARWRRIGAGTSRTSAGTAGGYRKPQSSSASASEMWRGN
jgi:aldehyde:ferredoxin oxidoreductase